MKSVETKFRLTHIWGRRLSVIAWWEPLALFRNSGVVYV